MYVAPTTIIIQSFHDSRLQGFMCGVLNEERKGHKNEKHSPGGTTSGCCPPTSNGRMRRRSGPSEPMRAEEGKEEADA